MAKKTVTFKIEGTQKLVEKLKQIEADTKEVLEAAAGAGAEIVLESANRNAPGPHIKKKVIERKKSIVSWGIGPDKDHWYYKFSETGTQPHEITTKGLLMFEGNEGTVITKSVQHTGMPASPFLRPAIDANKRAAADAVAQAFKKVMEQFK